MAKAKGIGGWTGAETRLLGEWLAKRWGHRTTRQRVRVGSIPPQLELPHLSPDDLRMVGVWRRWVDAIVIDPPRVHIIEAGIIAAPGDVSQLELYIRLFPQTPELREYAHLELCGRLLWAVPDPVVADMARERGLAVEVFSPPWIGKYLAGRLAHNRRPPLS